MPEARDPLQDLARAWQELQPRQTGGELAAEDAATREAVAWMRAAWQALPVPAPALPWLATRQQRRRRTRQALAAAALLLVALGLPWLLVRTGARPTPRSASAPAAAASAAREMRVEGGRLLAAAGGRFELRSGPVRLVLLAASLSPDDEPNIP